MTRSVKSRPGTRYALLASGANFSCEVLQALRLQNLPPNLLILPEYPPAQPAPNSNREILKRSSDRRLLKQLDGIEVGYAPVTRQSDCTNLIQRHAIDFLLVSCWPYLIGAELIASAAKAGLNLHPSLLPEYRGPDPVGQQLEQRESKLGVTLHLLSQQFDQGDIIAQAEWVDTGPGSGRSDIEHRCAVLGSELFIEAVSRFEQGWNPVPQLN